MNFFVDSLLGYLKGEMENVLTSPGGSRKSIFVVQSLDPNCTLKTFSELRQFCEEKKKNLNLEYHFKTATGLWNEWCRKESRKKLVEDMRLAGAVGTENDLVWIDEDDHFTKYRNWVLIPPKEALLVVLVGLDHASDKGGLADFHIVDEKRIWHSCLGQSFRPWILSLFQKLGLKNSSDNETDKEIVRFDNLFQQIFAIRPLQLVKLAEFIDREIINSDKDFYSAEELFEHIGAKLSFWGIPPLLDMPSSKGALYIKEAENFIVHKNFKTKSKQKEAWEKLEKALDEDSLSIPEVFSDAPVYENVSEFKDTLSKFIFEADAEAKNRLLKTNIKPVLDVIKKKSKTEASTITKKETSLNGLSLDIMLEAVWETLSEFDKRLTNQPLADVLTGIQIKVQNFNHDLTADKDAGVGAEQLAGDLLKGCLGGLEELLESIDIRLPIDDDQAQLPTDHWERVIPLTLSMDVDTIKYGVRKGNPHLLFQVLLETTDDVVIKGKSGSGYHRPFRWIFGPTHPERVRLACGKMALEEWQEFTDKQILPIFQLPKEIVTALYFAADEEEANRLLSQALTELKIRDMLTELVPDSVEFDLNTQVQQLSDTYRQWLQCCRDRGYYQAEGQYFLDLLRQYDSLATATLEDRKGSSDILRLIYKAFLLVDNHTGLNDGFLSSAVAWGISLPVMELSHARTRFLCDGFPEAVAELALKDNGKAAFQRLLSLAEIHRPLAGLVVDPQGTLSAEIKSFGLLHHLGTQPSGEKSLAVQTLLREEESDDDEDINDIIRPREESGVVKRVLDDYRTLYPFAEDGLRILALHVEDLSVILSGIDRFIKNYLKETHNDWPAFHFQVMVYTTSSSPLAMESRLTAWRSHIIEKYREQGRPLLLSVGHQFAPSQDKMLKLLEQEERLYDIAFLFHFLEGELSGEIEQALPFEFDFSSTGISLFPVCEYPRPIRQNEHTLRQSLLSNRRLRIQSRHADLSARLRYPQSSSRDHLVIGRTDYKPWQEVVEKLHSKAQWVACIDPFVDKRLLRRREGTERRKIVGFTSGLGAYGELNLSISTEQDTLAVLTQRIEGHLNDLLPFQLGDGFATMAARIVDEAEEIVGLSSLRAVVGQGEQIRDVVGFAAVRRALQMPEAAMSQLLPVDSLQHWFVDSDVDHRPDLLQLSLQLRENDLPLIQAAVIECKLAQFNNAHFLKACQQVQDGLQHLVRLFAPSGVSSGRVSFDRRYWWAQLQRAITSRSVVTSEEDWRKLDKALDYIAEGYFEIAWRGAICTFWTNEEKPEAQIEALHLSVELSDTGAQVPVEFAVDHLALGHQGLTALFSQERPAPLLLLEQVPIRMRPQTDDVFPSTAEQEAPDAGETEDRQESQDTVADLGSPSIEQVRVPDTADTGTGKSSWGSFWSKAVGFVAKESKTEKRTGLSDERPEPRAEAATSQEDQWSLEKWDEAPATDTAVVEKPEKVKSAVRVLTPSFVPDKILIGTRSNGDPVYWHYGHDKLANRHMLIFGASGSGKTYGIQCLLAEMALQSLHSLIIDYTDGFLPQQTENRFNQLTQPKNHFVATEKLPLNPFRRQLQIIDPSQSPVEEKSFQVATRIASIFISVFETMGDQQAATLTNVIEEGVESPVPFKLDDLPARLREKGQYGESLANKIEPLIKSQPFREGVESAWEDMITSPEHLVQILQLKGLAKNIQGLVTEFALWDLYDYACNTGSENRPIPVVLDEIQNLDHSSDSPLDKMLREGRKFGLSMILATQTTSNFNQEQRDRLFQAGHKLFFKPASTEIDRFAQILSQSTGEPKADWYQKLARLEKGQCWSLGPVLTSGGKLQEKAVHVSITPLEERG